MPAAHRIGDLASGHGCHPANMSISGSPNVFVNNIPSVRVTDVFSVHCCGSNCHASVQIGGAPAVFTNNLAQARIGDPIDCGEINATGSPNVFS